MSSGARPALEEMPDRSASSDIPAAASNTELHAANNRSAASAVALLSQGRRGGRTVAPFPCVLTCLWPHHGTQEALSDWVQRLRVRSWRPGASASRWARSDSLAAALDCITCAQAGRTAVGTPAAPRSQRGLQRQSIRACG